MPFLNRLDVVIISLRTSKFSIPTDNASNVSLAVYPHTELTGTHLYAPLDSMYC